jgi:hypothetical protein
MVSVIIRPLLAIANLKSVGYNPQIITIRGMLKMKVARTVKKDKFMKARIIKTTLLFVTLLSGIVASTAQAQTPYYSVECLYEWTLNCERLKMEEERAHREKMLEEMKRQNRILQQQVDQEKRALRWSNLD